MPLFRRYKAANTRPRELRREWARRQLRRIAILPSLMTLTNGICGLAAIHAVTSHTTASAVAAAMTAHQTVGPNLITPPTVTSSLDPTVSMLYLAVVPDGFAVAGLLLGLAMLADMLDGRLARFTRQTTDFGGQLDSLCDVVSFGAAPAVLAYHLSLDLMGRPAVTESLGPWLAGLLTQLAWLGGAAYFACAALRLARFNVENVQNENSHLWFKGLPSPGAAAAVGGLLLLRMAALRADAPAWAAAGLLVLISPTMVGLGLLMVSRYRYPHLVNQYLVRRRSFGYLARAVIYSVGVLMVLLLTGPQLAAAVAIFGYVLTSAMVGVWRQLTGQSSPSLPAAAAFAGTGRAGPVPATESGSPLLPTPSTTTLPTKETPNTSQ